MARRAYPRFVIRTPRCRPVTVNLWRLTVDLRGSDNLRCHTQRGVPCYPIIPRRALYAALTGAELRTGRTHTERIGTVRCGERPLPNIGSGCTAAYHLVRDPHGASA